MNLLTLFTERVSTLPADIEPLELALSWDIRQKSRFRAILATGQEIGVNLPRVGALRSGSVLVSSHEPVRYLRILAAPQPLAKVTAQQPFDLLKASYHLGNRHVPLMLTPDALYLEPDHVLEDMLRGLGLTVAHVNQPFEPEQGAYHQHEHRLKPFKPL